MIRKEDLAEIGRFGKPHGYKGEINLAFDQFGDDAWLEEGLPLIVETDGIFVPFYPSAFRTKGADFLVSIDGYGSDKAVKAFANRPVYGLREQVEELYPDFADSDEMNLIGYALFDAEGRRVGVIEDVDDSTSNLLLKVSAPDGREILVPVHEDLFRNLDDDARTLSVELPEGLLDLND